MQRLTSVWRLLESRAWTIAVACALATLAVGVVACAALGDDTRFYDETQYLAIGENVADHGSYSFDGQTPTAYRTPGYPLLIAGARFVGVPLPGVRFLNFVFVALTVLAVYALARRLAGPAAGALAALGAAAYPLFIFTATTYYPQTMATFFLVATVLCVALAVEAAGRRRSIMAALAGLSAGILMLVVPTFAYAVPLVLVWLAFAHRQALLRVGIPLLAAALVLPAAWTIRNQISMDDFVPLSTTSGFNLLVGNHEGATPTTGYELEEIGPYQNEAKRRGLDEIETDAYLGEIARDWISENKGKAVALYFGKLANNFAPYNRLETGGQSSPLRNAVLVVTYIPLLALFVWRLVLIRRGYPLRRLEALMVAFVFVNALLLAIYTTRIRYRLPLDLLTVVIVACFVADLARRRLKASAPAVGTPPAVVETKAASPTT